MKKTANHPVNPHILPIRVYYDDTDAGGIVYHANYLVFAERGRTEFLRTLGHDHNQILAEHNLLFVIRHIDISYRASARLDDMLELHTEVVSCGRTSIGMKQIFYRDGKTLVEIKVTIVAITPEKKTMTLPPALRDLFAMGQNSRGEGVDV